MSLCNDTTSTTMLVQPATCTNGNGNDGFGWGGNWFAYVFLFALLFGCGGYGGFGGFGGGYGMMNGAAGPVAQGYDTRADIQRGFDNQSVTNKLNGLENGICSLGYDQLAQMNGINANISAGFAGVNNSVCQLGYQNADLIHGVSDTVNQGFNATNLAIMQGNNALQSQLASCCCDTREAISGVNYNMAMGNAATQNAIQQNTTQGVMNTAAIQNQISQCCCDNRYDSAMQANATQAAIRDGFCQTGFAAQTNTRDIIEAQNANTRAILDKLTSQELEAKNAQIAAQNQQIFALQLKASQEAQNNYLIGQLGQKCPQPAYVVQPPQSVAFPTTCGTASFGNYGCGCNAA